MSSNNSQGTIPSADELVARAQAMIPMLREQADAVEKARSVPPATIEAFKQAGFFRILQPRRWGGWEMTPDVFFRVLMELGRGCGSSAWNMMILGVHQWEFGLLDPRCGDDVWGADDTVITASSYAPFGTARKVEGGYILNGTWGTSSGTDHGEWAFIGGLIKDDNGVPTDRRAFLIPRSDYEFLDDWFVFGLAGTGSKSLIIKDAFVPEYRSHSMIDYHVGTADTPLSYRFPFYTAFFAAVASVMIGFAQGGIDIFIEQMKKREYINNIVAKPVLDHYAKDRLGNAVTKVRSARLRLLGVLGECAGFVSNGKPVPLDLRVHHTLDIARVGRECEEAVLLLYKALSARGIYLSNPMQRVLRDTLVGANHITQNADHNAEALGGMLLGQAVPPLMYELPAAM